MTVDQRIEYYDDAHQFPRRGEQGVWYVSKDKYTQGTYIWDGYEYELITDEMPN